LARNIKKEVKKQKQISYSNRDFGGFKNELKRYISTHFNSSIVDTSDASLAGMLVDLAAYVGDVSSYYIDYQFNENSLENATQVENIERLVRESGVEIAGPSPAIAEVRLRIRVPATIDANTGQYIPNSLYCPVIKKETVLSSRTNVEFILLDDVDFSEKDADGLIIGDYKIGQLQGSVPLNFIVERYGFCTSSKTKTETFSIGDGLVPFRKITLTEQNVNEVISVTDTDGDEYFEVESLTQDTVYKRSANSRADVEYAPERLLLQHAPKRFVKTRTSTSGKTSLRFGAGDEEQFDEDIIPDPSEHAVTLFGDRKVLRNITIDPNSFLGTQTLGIAPRNTTLTVRYRHGGGLRDNVSAGAITQIKSVITNFTTSTPTSIAVSIRSSLTVFNEQPAAGGEDEPSIEELRTIALFSKNAQRRVVTREDLIARVYSMPSNFGRVFRVSVRDNPNNPQAAQLSIISRDSSGKLILSPDTLKLNLGNYLSKHRLISDAIDILDAAINNIALQYAVTIDPTANSSTAINVINAKLIEYFNIKNFQIDQPIVIGEIENLILNSPSVISIIELKFSGRAGEYLGNTYSDFGYDPSRFIDRGFIFPSRGGIFEVKFPNEDIIGKVS
jgi:hypothetical protein